MSRCIFVSTFYQGLRYNNNIFLSSGFPRDAGEQGAGDRVQHGLPDDALPLWPQAVHHQHRGQRLPRGQAGRGGPQVTYPHDAFNISQQYEKPVHTGTRTWRLGLEDLAHFKPYLLFRSYYCFVNVSPSSCIRSLTPRYLCQVSWAAALLQHAIPAVSAAHRAAESGAGWQTRVSWSIRVQCRGWGRDPPRYWWPLWQCSWQVNTQYDNLHHDHSSIFYFITSGWLWTRWRWCSIARTRSDYSSAPTPSPSWPESCLKIPRWYRVS